MNFLLRQLLHWFIFAGTSFFAAGAVIDAGAGATDGNIEQGAESDAGATDSHSETSDDGSVGGDDGVPGEVSSEEVRSDGRTLPKEVQTALKALKEAHPEHAKALDELRKSYFSSRQHGEFFKTPAEARQAKATLELVGGSEGIANLQSQVAAIELVDTAFEQGDPQVLEDIASDYPDGFKKLISPALDKLQAMDAAAYGKTIQPHVFSALEAAGLGPVLDAIGQAIVANDLSKAKDLVGKSLNWYEGQKQQAGQRPRTDDPERAKFEQQKKDFAQTQEKTFREDIGRQTVGHQSEQINKALAPYLKSKALSADAKADLADGVNREINRLLKADGTYQSQVKALLTAKTRDAGKIVQYINAAVDEATTKAAKAVWGRRYGTFVPAKPAQTPGQKQAAVNPANSGPIKIAAKPNRADVDWDKTKDILFITSKAWMKAGPYKGKLVAW
jgi:hypothetical protein